MITMLVSTPPAHGTGLNDCQAGPPGFRISEGLMLKLKPQYLATWCKELTHWKRPWCWERLKAGEEGDDRWWDGWVASPTRWTWVGASSRSWWWTGKPGVLQSMGLQRVGHELNWRSLRSFCPVELELLCKDMNEVYFRANQTMGLRPLDLQKPLKGGWQIVELSDSHNIITLSKNSHEI